MSLITSEHVTAEHASPIADHHAAPPAHPLERSRDLWLMLVNELLDNAEGSGLTR